MRLVGGGNGASRLWWTTGVNIWLWVLALLGEKGNDSVWRYSPPRTGLYTHGYVVARWRTDNGGLKWSFCAWTSMFTNPSLTPSLAQFGGMIGTKWIHHGPCRLETCQNRRKGRGILNGGVKVHQKVKHLPQWFRTQSCTLLNTVNVASRVLVMC